MTQHELPKAKNTGAVITVDLIFSRQVQDAYLDVLCRATSSSDHTLLGMSVLHGRIWGSGEGVRRDMGEFPL